MNPLILIGILFALLLALIGYACIVVGSDADRAEEAYLEQRRAQTNRRNEPAEREINPMNRRNRGDHRWL